MRRLILLLLGLPALVGTAQLQAASLVNLSTRGNVGTGNNNLVSGFVIGGSTNETVLVRAIGPTLAEFGASGLLANPVLTIFNSAETIVGTNSSWGGTQALVTVFAQTGAFALPLESSDAALLVTLPAGSYTAQVAGSGNTTGVALLEVYDVGGGNPLINLSSRLVVGSGANAAYAGFVVGGSVARKLLIRSIGPGLSAYGISGVLADPAITLFDSSSNVLGTAVADGNASALASAYSQSGAFPAGSGDSAVIATLNPGAYTVEAASSSGTSTGVALIEVYDITGTTGTPAGYGMNQQLFLATLRPPAGAASSTASGYATVAFNPNTGTGTVNLSFSNLSSTEVVAHLEMGTPGAGTIVFGLTSGQVSAQNWTFGAQGQYSSSQIISALQSGQIFVEIDSASYPAGELFGTLAAAHGSQTFTAPAASPALPANALTSPSETDAVRFLTQATFGPTLTDINTVMSEGIPAWISNQMSLPASSHLAGINADVASFPNPPAPPGTTYAYACNENREAAWWKIVVTGPDQLRQRVALALSEIFVVSTQVSLLNGQSQGLANYYDILVNDAFGNFRQLLNDVTLNPCMGMMLSWFQNYPANPVTGTNPDENYAREVQQLFTIGLVQLQPDGSLLLDSTGLPIPTYDQATIDATAKVFTGWNFGNSAFYTSYPADTYASGAAPGNGWLVPMQYFDAYHDKSEKDVVSLQQVPLSAAAPTVIPANQTGPQDLKIMLDTLFNHPNTGPFFCKQLIQRLVTSNPSPGYVYRVAQVFANDGTGVRGNLGAVVTAILTDYEARSLSLTSNVGYGKIKEPLLRATGFFRAMNAAAPNGRWMDTYFNDPTRTPVQYYPTSFTSYPIEQLDEGPLDAPSVFNFFSPNYSPPGAMAAAGLVAPEMQITDANFVLNVPNQTANYLYRTIPTGGPTPSPYIVLDYSSYLPLASNPGALIDQINLLFFENQMSAATRSQMLSTLAALVPGTSATEIVQSALNLTLYAPEAALQR